MSALAALYPGSFDPPHPGHLDIIARAAAQVQRLVVVVAVHPDKHGTLSLTTRCEILRAATAHLPQVQVMWTEGNLRDLAKSLGISLIIRGIRGNTDLDHEAPMAWVHATCSLETMFLLSRPEHAQLSSRTIRAMAAAGLDPAPLLGPSLTPLVGPHLPMG